MCQEGDLSITITDSDRRFPTDEPWVQVKQLLQQGLVSTPRVALGRHAGRSER